jgi:hypothetical protein
MVVQNVISTLFSKFKLFVGKHGTFLVQIDDLVQAIRRKWNFLN